VAARESERPSLFVLTGTNGAGKSSIAGALIRARGADYFRGCQAFARADPSTDPVLA
jgi:predicted ATPase